MRYLGPELAEPDHDDVPNLDRVERLPDASHWVHHDEAERVNAAAHRLLRPCPTSHEPLKANVVTTRSGQQDPGVAFGLVVRSMGLAESFGAALRRFSRER